MRGFQYCSCGKMLQEDNLGYWNCWDCGMKYEPFLRPVAEVAPEKQELADRVYTTLEDSCLKEWKTLGMDEQGELIAEIVRRLS